MEPAAAGVETDRLHPVVANVDEASAPRSQPLHHTDRDQFAMHRRPTLGVIVAREILRRFASFDRETVGCELSYMVAQDRVTEPARSAVDAKIYRIARNPELLAAFRTRDALDRL